MKACPYCAEQIQDAAVKCRFCGADLGLSPGGPTDAKASAPADVEERPVELLHLGTRYGLGTGSGFYGIWDAQAPGAPVRRFPSTPEGWGEAWTVFSTLEPAARPTGMGSVATGPRASPGIGGLASGATAPPVSQTNAPGVAALVLGIVALLLSAFPVVGVILGIVAIAFAAMGLKRADVIGTGRGMAVAGLVLGALSVIVGLLVVALFNEVVDQVGRIQDFE